MLQLYKFFFYESLFIIKIIELTRYILNKLIGTRDSNE
jgi:hypothetical protein